MLGSLEEGLAAGHRYGLASVKTFRGELLNQNCWGNLLSAAASHAQIKALCVPTRRLGYPGVFPCHIVVLQSVALWSFFPC
jgi:hypothetical protein